MSNRVTITPTEFVSCKLDGTVEYRSWGLRVADDYSQTYCNTYERDEIIGKSPAEIVTLARQIDDAAEAMISFAEEEDKLIDIGSDTYSFDELFPSPKIG